jgi:hypothetical protein
MGFILALLMWGNFMEVSAMCDTTYVKPYIKKDGSFVEGHYRTTPDSYTFNNMNTYDSYKVETPKYDNYKYDSKKRTLDLYDND